MKGPKHPEAMELAYSGVEDTACLLKSPYQLFV